MNMFKLALILIVILGLQSCFSTRNKRRKDNSFDLSLFDSDPLTTPNDDNTSDDNTSDDNDSGANDPPAHISHCQWSKDGTSGFQFNASHIGDYTLCKSTNADTDLFFQLKTNPGYNICLIPVHEKTDGNITYIGEPRCLLASDPHTVYKIVIFKNRPTNTIESYSDKTLTGVIITQDRAYEFGAPYYPYYNMQSNPLSATSAYIICENWAQTGYTQYCTAFNTAGHYVYHKF